MAVKLFHVIYPPSKILRAIQGVFDYSKTIWLLLFRQICLGTCNFVTTTSTLSQNRKTRKSYHLFINSPSCTAIAKWNWPIVWQLLLFHVWRLFLCVCVFCAGCWSYACAPRKAPTSPTASSKTWLSCATERWSWRLALTGWRTSQTPSCSNVI